MQFATDRYPCFVHLSSPVSEPPRAATPDPLQALRSATAAQHAQLDARLAIAAPGASLADYARHARALAAWLQALQPHLHTLQATAPEFDFTPPARLAALQADLHGLQAAAAGAWPPPCEVARRHAAAALAGHAGQPAAVCWGFAYVVEGSQLGGQVLYRRLAQRLAPHPLRYLQGAGAATGQRWARFLALLRSQLACGPALRAACDGATAAFAALQEPGALAFNEVPA